MASSVAGNEDLLTEILLRLPVKPLMRFKCVSKQWLTLISSQRFCHSHTLRQYRTSARLFPSSVLLTPLATYPCLAFPIVPLTSSEAHPSTLIASDFHFLNVPHLLFDIIQSCNGLLLVQGIPLEMCHHWNEYTTVRRYFVCNPITKQFVALTFPNLTFVSRMDSLCLAFDPLRSPHFKVVVVVTTVLEIKVYSSETGRWSDLEISVPSTSMSSGIYCNGAIYWCARAEKSLYFDVENQCLKTYPMPNIGDQEIGYFGESGGHLHMMLLSEQEDMYLGRPYFAFDAFDILELKEDYSGWFVRFHVDLNPFNVFREWYHKHTPLCVIRQEKEEDSILVFFSEGGVMSYNLVDSTFRELSGFKPFIKSYYAATGPIMGATNITVFEFLENHSWVGASTG